MRAPSRRCMAWTALLVIAAGCQAKSGEKSPVLTFDCGAIALVPPIIQAHSSLDGTVLCQLDFTAVAKSPDDATFAPFVIAAASCDESPAFVGCPASRDGVTAACDFALIGLADPNFSGVTYSVRVASPRFRPTVVANVHAGQAGCVTPQAASSSSVALDPS